MSNLNENGFNSFSPYVALIHQIIDDVIRNNGGGTVDLSNYKTAAQVDTAINVAINNIIGGAPDALNTLQELAAALSNNADFANTVMNSITSKLDNTAVATQAEAQAGTLTSKYMTPQRVAQAIAALSPSGVSAFSSLTDKISADIVGTNTGVQNALAGKVSILAPADLGSTGTPTVSFAAHGNRVVTWSGPTAFVGVSAGGPPPEGGIIAITNNGPGTLTYSSSDVSVPAGFQLAIVSGSTGAVIWSNGGWHSLIPSTSSVFVIATVTGSNSVGSLKTCTPASGYVGTYQWYWSDTGANITGATSATYTIVTGDIGHTVSCKFTPTYYATIGAVATGAADTTAPAPVGAPHVDIGSPTITRQNFGEALVSNGITAADCTISGKTVTSVTISGTELQITTATAWTSGQTGTLTVAANKLKDAAGNLCAAITAAAITNNIISGAGFSDNMTRANNSSSPNPASDGGAWTIGSGTWGILNNQLHRFSNTEDHIWRDAGTANGTFSANVGSITPDFVYPSLIFRLVDNNNFMLLNIDFGHGHWDIYTCIAGTYTSIASGSMPAGFNGVGTYGLLVHIALAGSAITITCTNADVGTNTAMGSATSTQFQTATNFGMRCSDASTNNAYYDTVSFVP